MDPRESGIALEQLADLAQRMSIHLGISLALLKLRRP